MGASQQSWLRPILSILPEIRTPKVPVHFKDKCMYTLFTITIFLVMSQLPLYGISNMAGPDPLYWVRALTASSRGSLMCIGVSPLITSGMVIQLLTGAKILNIDPANPADKKFVDGATKILAIIITFVQAIGYVYSGMYGPTSEMGMFTCLLIVAQLLFSGFLIMCLDDLMSAGYGLGGSGISLFMAINSCETIFWKAFNPFTIKSARGTEVEGAFFAFFHLLFTRKDKISALKEAFYRPHLPNMMQLTSTIIIFFVVIYLQGLKVDLPIVARGQRGGHRTYPIKLFYTSNMPVILQSALTSNIFFLSQLAFDRYGQNIFVRWFGSWKEMGYNGHKMPVGGLAYYLSSPHSFGEAVSNPIRMIVYIAFVLFVCSKLATTWIEISGQSPHDVAMQLNASGVYFKGNRDTVKETKRVLNRYIPTAAAFGGVAIGLLTIASDMMGVIGSGTGILLAVGIVYQFIETLQREQEEAGYSKNPMAFLQ